MTIRTDPENNETHALFDMVDFRGKRVLEIGCGDGRLTWRYADKAGHVTAIDPSSGQISLAMAQLPHRLRGRVEFYAITFEDFAFITAPSAFDIVVLSYSLC
jgi:2-polyprenyl-3-methyl-5-hydroxy-6-metoxy-1,4-benzoquinol methylase